jgi:hypothetical protein
MTTLTKQLLGSASLKVSSYEEIESDRHATWQAIAIVILSSLGAAIGIGNTSLSGIAALLFFAIATWMIWVLLTLFIGTQLLPGKQTQSDFAQTAAHNGVLSGAGILRVLGVVPVSAGFCFWPRPNGMLFTYVGRRPAGA